MSWGRLSISAISQLLLQLVSSSVALPAELVFKTDLKSIQYPQPLIIDSYFVSTIMVAEESLTEKETFKGNC